MNQKYIALLGHLVLCVVVLWGAHYVEKVGLIDFFFWTGLAIGVWSAVGTPKVWRFSFGVGAAQIIVQTITLIAIMVQNAHEEMAELGEEAPSSEGAEIFVFFTMVKSLFVFLIAVGIVRGIHFLAKGLLRRSN